MIYEEYYTNLIGATVFTIDYVSYEIVPRKVKSISGANNLLMDLLDTDNNVIGCEYFHEWVEAKEFLVDYCESILSSLDMKRLNDVLDLEEKEFEGTW